MGKGAFIFYESFLDAMEEMDGETVKETLFAIGRYALTGEEPIELRGWSKSVFVMARPQIDANKERYEKSLNGGRPQIELPTLEELNAMISELGSIGAVANALGVDRATIYRRINQEKQSKEDCRKTVAKLSQKSQNLSQVAKPNDNVNDNVNVDVSVTDTDSLERVGETPPMDLQANPALLETDNFSENSVFFPTEAVSHSFQVKELPKSQETICKHKTKSFVPPTVEEVAEYCQQRNNGIDAEAFVAFYASKGWYVGKNKMKDWKQCVITWEKRNNTQSQYSARASPTGAAASCDRAWNENRQIF